MADVAEATGIRVSYPVAPDGPDHVGEAVEGWDEAVDLVLGDGWGTVFAAHLEGRASEIKGEDGGRGGEVGGVVYGCVLGFLDRVGQLFLWFSHKAFSTCSRN